MAVVQEYFTLTRKYIEQFGEKTVLWYQVGSFYEMYANREEDGSFSGCNVKEFARIGNLTIGNKTAKTVMLGFSTYMIEKYIPCFQDAGYTIVVYDQDANVKNTTRSLKGIISPGTYFSQDCNKVDNNIMSMWIEPIRSRFSQAGPGSIVIGIANINVLTGAVTILEFIEEFLPDMHTTYNDIERTLSIYKPSELLIVSNESYESIQRMLPFFNYTPSKHHIFSINETDDNTREKLKNCEKQVYQHEILSHFFKDIDHSLYSEYDSRPISTQSLCYLLNFVEMHNSNLVNRLITPSIDMLTSRLILENHSLKQLNIIDDGTSSGSYSSVVKHLNKCITPMGKRKLENILLNPTTNIKRLSNEYDITEFIIDNLTKFKFLSTQLTNMKDVERLTRQIVMRKITPNSIASLYDNLDTLKEIFENIHHFPYFEQYLSASVNVDIVETADMLKTVINNTIDIDIARGIDTLAYDVNFIKKGVNPDLDNLVSELTINSEMIQSIKEYLHRLIATHEKKNSTTEYVKLHETDKKGLTLCATKKRCETLKSCITTKLKKNEYDTLSTADQTGCKIKLSDIIFKGTTSKTESCISSPQISECLEKIWVIRQQMKDKINELYLVFLSQLQEEMTLLNEIVKYITSVDVAYTKAFVAHKFNYIKPTIIERDNSFLNIEGLRHCLIENISQQELYVTNDISLGVEGKSCNGVLLYGTNAVGKTSLIRAIGISIVMAQAGFYVPCSSMTFSPYNHIFTRILSNDNLFQGHSTFTAEICEIRRIIENANSKSLILGDEICSGTEINSAISIFIAALEKLHQNNSSFIFATHLHMVSNYKEITQLENLQKKHMTVEYQPSSGKLVYDRKLRDGTGSDMYGLEVCKSMSLPQDFIERCYRIREKYGDSSILSSRISKYNSSKLKHTCQLCKSRAADHIHHLCYQKEAGDNGYISSFHKDHAANLIGLCEECHHDIHTNNERYRAVKTSEGMELFKLE